MTRKGQTATEYITIISVVLIISLVLMNVISTAPLSGSSSSTKIDSLTLQTQPIVPDEYYASCLRTDFSIQNRERKTIRIEELFINSILCIEDKVLLSGKTLEIECGSVISNCEVSKESDLDLVISYESNGVRIQNTTIPMTIQNVKDAHCDSTFCWLEVQPAGNTGNQWFTTSGTTMSKNGATIVTGAQNGRLYITQDRGKSWTEIRPSSVDEDSDWRGAVSIRENTIIAASNQRLYISTDLGLNWTEVQPDGNNDRPWYVAGLSDSGQYVLAGTGSFPNGSLYVSNDYGNSWTTVGAPAGGTWRNWHGAGVSGDGSTMIAGSYSSGRLFRSTNFGTTWSEVQPAGAVNRIWWGMDISSDGSRIIAGTSGGRLYMSNTTGASWSEVRPSGADADGTWEVASLSSSGQYVVAADKIANEIYYSGDYGTSWVTLDPTTSLEGNWQIAAISDDGNYIFAGTRAGVNTGRVYVGFKR